MGGNKLTPSAVAEIKYLLTAKSKSRFELAREYGVSTTTIRHIALGETWRDVEAKAPRED